MYKNILITGAGGTVGYALTNFYLSQGINVYAVDRSEEAVARLLDVEKEKSYNGKLQVFFDDIQDLSFQKKILEVKELECIVHCASLKHFAVGSEFPEKVFNENIAVFKKIEDLVRVHLGIQKVILCSSDKAAQPISSMGQSKKKIEELSENVKVRNVDFINVRFANILYSSGSLLQKLEECIQQKKKFSIRDGEMTRYLLTKREVILLIDFALRLGKHGDVICLLSSSARIQDVVYEYLRKRESEIEVVLGENPFSESIHESLFNMEELQHVYKKEGYLIYNRNNKGNLDDLEENRALSSKNALSKDSLKKLYE
ncbi:MAG: SDR family NAD(P)-dependent oxidoreductase [Candidatus Moranbacteria bacterium]|nr:SDR family NAD(P)-dependent oxidoreductase [Candidatus Moranbacteria bacterium]